MHRRLSFALVSGLLVACGGSTSGSGSTDVSGTGGGGGSVSSGGSVSAGGSIGGAGNSGGALSTGGSSVDCSLVGCGAPPLCATGCFEPCGCCPCAEGESNGAGYVCVGGCYAPLADSGACDPAAEQHMRSYVGTSPAQCAVIDFMCPVNTTYFSNACGCGCEQSPSCPEWFDCMASPQTQCDIQQIQTQCPYSGIAY
jgi:hypothetical protein